VAQIVVENVSKVYPVGTQTIPAVTGVSLSIEQGDFISIVGHSGSGKTTLLSLIGGITSPTAGSILFDGKDISALPSDELSYYRCGKIGFMFQFASLLPMLNVQENVMLPTLFSRSLTAPGESAGKAAELIGLVGLGDKIGMYPSQLSGGQQRRVAIARAFMNRPAVILADEPTGDLDEETEQDMMGFFKEMNNTEMTTFIMVTHNTDLARQTKRQLRMHQGRIVSQ
jgi:putative ABC transport system ATP-binding protein/lipoprotein-releasing system ATP-binding protein